jgi:chromate transporter
VGTTEQPSPTAGYPASLRTVVREWGRIGCIGFGGPPAHIALLRKLCVDDRQWLEAAEFEDAIAVCNLLPGPASTELAILCAWRVRGRLGALAGGAAFIVPGLIVILALSALFLATSPPAWVRGAGAGAGSAVAAVAVQAGWSLLVPSWRRASGVSGGPGATADPGPPGASCGLATAGGLEAPAARRPVTYRKARWVAYLAAGGLAAGTIGPWLVLVLVACGLIELAVRRRSTTRRPTGRVSTGQGSTGRDSSGRDSSGRDSSGQGLAGLAPMGLLVKTALLGKTAAGATVGAGVFAAIAWVAFKVGALSFGGGFVIIPLMQADAVGRHWMTNAQFLNAVALGQITPGPVVQTVAAVGYAAAGIPGGLLASLVAFTPSFVFVLAGARHFSKIRTNDKPQAFLDGTGPAAIGAILGSAYLLARALSQPWQFAILAATVLLLLVVRRGVVATLLCAAVAGVIIVVAGAPLPG